jgi:hypothetical protein
MNEEFPFNDITIKRYRPSENLIWLWLAPQLPVCLPKDVIRYVCTHIVHTVVIPKSVFLKLACKRYRWRYYRILCDWSEQGHVTEISPKHSGRTQCLRFLIECIPNHLRVLFVVTKLILITNIWNEPQYHKLCVRSMYDAKSLVLKHKWQFDFIIFNNCTDDFAYHTNAKVLCIMRGDE